MADIVNLRQARKRKEREAREARAAENRAAFGRGKAERELASAQEDQERRRLDGHRRDDPPE
jgi:hypothetical protein